MCKQKLVAVLHTVWLILSILFPYQSFKKIKIKADEERTVYYCHKCPLTRNSKETLKKHLSNSHGYPSKKNGTIDCAKCGEKVEDTSLFLHYKNVHNRYSKYDCGIEYFLSIVKLR